MWKETLSAAALSLAVGLVMLFSGMQLWWAVDALRQSREVETAGNGPAVPILVAIPERIR